MPIDYTIDATRDLVVQRFRGRVDNAELLAHLRALQADPDVGACALALVDLSELTDVAFDASAVSAIALTPPIQERPRIAFVAPTDVSFGFARVFHGFASDRVDIEVFRERAAALAWLGERPQP